MTKTDHNKIYSSLISFFYAVKTTFTIQVSHHLCFKRLHSKTRHNIFLNVHLGDFIQTPVHCFILCVETFVGRVR